MAAAQPADSVDDVIITAALAERDAPPRDIVAEHRALSDLARQAAMHPAGLFQLLANLAIELCDAGSAGISLLEPAVPGEGVFRWVALSGAYKDYVDGTTPEWFSPCGVCLERGGPQLYDHPARVFTYLADATPPIVEGLVIPLRSSLEPLGTIWIVSHGSRRFTSSDVAVMTTLADFTSAAIALQRAREQAEALSRAKDEFLAVASHELRSPLTAIIGWSELLLAGRATPAAAARAIASIHASARRQEAMVEDLLDTSRVVTGTLRVSDAVCDLAVLVRAGIEMVTEHAHARGLEIDASVEGSLPFRGDPERLLQVVGNLLANAVKFTPDRGRITVTLTVTSASVQIVVSDTGVGIAAEVLPSVFDPFRQADGGATRRNGGLGLGLTIARRLVELHDGRLEAASDGLECGATFTVTLPSARCTTAAIGVPRTTVRNRLLAGIAVLIVDDERDIREMLSCMLEDAGATAISASNVAAAMDSLSRHRVDVLLADLAMPAEDGYGMMARLASGEATIRPRTTIAVTALTTARDRRRIAAAGFDHYVSKPVDFDLLCRLIGESVNGAPQR